MLQSRTHDHLKGATFTIVELSLIRQRGRRLEIGDVDDHEARSPRAMTPSTALVFEVVLANLIAGFHDDVAVNRIIAARILFIVAF